MNEYLGNYDKGIATSTSAYATLMRNVYTWMACGLAMTGLAAWLIAGMPNVLYAIMSNSILFWGLMIAEIGIVIYFSTRIMKMEYMTAGILFALYSIINGVTMSFIFLAYTMESISQTFFITAGTFAGMAFVGTVVKKDLSSIGRFLTMLLIGLIIATVVNLFVASSGLAMLLNYAGVVIFVGLTAYDAQKIKEMMYESSAYGETEQTNKLALLGALTLYLDFINLFLYLLRLFGNRRD